MLGVASCGRFHFDARNDATDDATGSRANYAFVTSSLQLPTSFGADLAGADLICNMRAQEVPLPGTYVAWLSSSTSAARDRLVADRFCALRSNSRQLDETGASDGVARSHA